MSKRRKVKVDRISNLPNCIIHHILSFLNTKYVVQTSVLSKRWRSVWESIPDLNFDFASFTLQERYYTYSRVSKSFKRFILHVLSHRHGDNIQKLKYFFDDVEEPNFVKMLICYAVCHNVQELYIDAWKLESLEWPRCSFTCESLNSLKLVGCNVMKWIPSGLSALKSLYLESSIDDSYEFKGEIINGYPNLESLVLVNFPFEHIQITAAKLSNLEIHYDECYSVCDSEIVISAPRLTSVVFQGLLPVINSVENLSYLDKVDVDSKCYNYYGAKEKGKIALNLITMLSVLRNAKSFTLSMKIMKLLSKFPDLLEGQPSLFCNLRHLKLKAKKISTMINMPTNVMAHLFKNSACVETMVVELAEQL